MSDDATSEHQDALRARVIVVAGPSGSGKSRLCARLRSTFGTPVVNLDDFYKDGDDPTLPRRRIGPGHDIVDWDDPRSWSREDALEALHDLCRYGVADLRATTSPTTAAPGTSGSRRTARRTSSPRACSPRR